MAAVEPVRASWPRRLSRWVDRLVPLALAAFTLFISTVFTHELIRRTSEIWSWRSLIFFAVWVPTTLFFVLTALKDMVEHWKGSWDFPGAKPRPPQADTHGRAALEAQADYFRPAGPKFDLSRLAFFRWLFHRRWYQFAAQLPNVIIFNIVIVAGLIGVADPNRNFATVITWYVWFAVVFLLMLGIGRAWCLICPFSAQAEWLQRLSVFGKRKKPFTLGRKWPKAYSTVLISAFFFVGITWVEEFYNVAGPGAPVFTALLVLGIISWDVFYALVFERRSFCRYGCPLNGLIGTLSAVAPFEGFRSKDQSLCKTCTTKECMRGSARSYGCAWFEYPGSMTSNFHCGLAGECFKGCPYENVGMAVRLPLTDTYAPKKKRFDVALGVTLMMGVLFFEVFNATPPYAALDAWLNRVTGWGTLAQALFTQVNGYPNPLDYLAVVAVFPLLFWGLASLVHRLSGCRLPVRELFSRFAYGWIPLFGFGILARQLPKFLTNAPVTLVTLSDPFGFGWNLLGTAHWHLVARAFAPTWVLWVQLGAVAVGLAASLYSTARIARLDFGTRPGSGTAVAVMQTSLVVLGAALMLLYYVAAATNPGHYLSPPF
ncbi:MAG: 4Fe-4S binding protein [Firmicutes bacterium]|nr:4Fe-4S binding protein [Bacillota bacterium]